ncbi:MAG TPA: chromosome segregation protein SMC [Candidatus Acidoferrales bacterium]|nr:chromosome segregation protein SMC [Candidatus Acidoferrales bacterium]
MRLKSLRLFGFKTFAEQTVLTFEPGVTGIVGPNGSGKSNLVDAIRWVLGEQSPKSLRSTKTEDVIFAGNERRKPLGMAEVSLTFDNEDRRLQVDAAEVQLTRRAYRAGESEFFINREHVRLRDLVEILMGTGLGPGSYAIVSQGQIDAILSSKPVDRRSLFEETAGINRFLARKNESLRRLEQTEQNGVRISDLLAEITARIPELETQSRRARRFRKASARLRDLEILSYVRATTSRRAEREALQSRLDGLEAERAGAASKTTVLDADLSALRTQLYTHELKLEDLRETETQVRGELAELESHYAAMTARREALEAQSLQITDDRERTAAERTELETTIGRLEGELAPMAIEVEAQRERESKAHEALAMARAALDRIYAELRDVEAQAAAAAADEAERRAQLQATRGDFERLEREVYELRETARERSEAAAAHQALHEDADAQMHAREEQLARATEASSGATQRVTRATEELARAQEALRTASSEMASTEARLHTIEELEANLEGHIPGTRATLEAQTRGELSGIQGVVSQLIRVDEPYARALDIAFGAALSNIVTTTAEDAERAIAYLSARELGRATFLPLDTLGTRTGRGPGDAPRIAGVIGYAHTSVQADPAYAGIVAFLVGRILIVESLEVGVRLVRGQGFRDTVVTLDGDEIRGGGAMTGGRYRRERSILSRAAQGRALRQQLPKLKAALDQAEQRAAAATQEGAAATRERDETRRQLEEIMRALGEAQNHAQAAAHERERLAHEAQALLARAQERETELGSARERLLLLERPVTDPSATTAERERLEVSLAHARETIAAAQEAERAIATEIAGLRESIAALSAQRAGAHARLAILDQDHERAAHAREAMLAEIAALGEKIEQSQAALEAAHERVAQAAAAGEAARREREQMTARASELDSSLRLAQIALREATQTGDEARLRLAEIDAELGMLAAQFAQNPATIDECADVERRYAQETGDFGAEITRLREEIARLQNVNLNAEAEIEELVEREKFLTAQLDDLARAREALLAGIAEIETQTQEQFNVTFEKVRTAFTDVYARLFPGGEAKMWQTNAEQLSETGIEISVQPPGKKMMTLASLSGGERAMTSAALIFALIAVKPSPFYLLDEIDAALDDANVERFSQMVRELAADAQMIIVTHNKQTMELADRMYGVTMAEPGISSIIAADLSEAQPEMREERAVAVTA